MQARHAAELAELQASFPQRIVRRLAEALVRGEGPFAAPAALAAGAAAPAAWKPIAVPPPVAPPPAVPPAAVASPAANGNGHAAPSAPAPAPAAVVAAAAAATAVEPWIDSALCTSCDECIRLNPRMFAYDGDKRAYVKDPTAGTFKQLVQAAERCTARIIHPGTPLDADEPDLATWLKRAEPFA